MRREVVGAVLLERDQQLQQLGAAIEAVRSGSSSVVVISGPAGSGKTSLLQTAAEQARGVGLEVLTARGEELERDLGHGVTRQLLDPAMAKIEGDERAALLDGAASLAAPVLGLPAPPSAQSADPEFAARHGLSWLLAGLAERRPIVLVLDDVQWADAPALRWLAYLVQRLDQLAVMVLLARRSGEDAADGPALDAICRDARELGLAPLSRAAVAELMYARTGLAPDDSLVEKCLAASGGNPFLLVATLAALDDEGTPSLRQPLAGARRVAPVILRRLARLSADATALARAVTVLGDGAELTAAAQLAGLSSEQAAVAADALVLADLFTTAEQLGFAHGLVRDAVASDIGPHALRAAHAEAARVLRGFDAPSQRIASHLLLAPPARDPLAAGDLRHAAQLSLAQGAPTTSVTLLRRALDEPPPPSELGGVLLELGLSELASGAPSAAERLGEAIGLLDDPPAQATAAQAQTMALIGQGRVDDAVATIERVRPAVSTRDAQLLTLDALQLTLSMAYISRDAERHQAVARLRDALLSAQPGATETRGAAVVVAAGDAIEGKASSLVRGTVDQAWGEGALLDALGPEHIFCMFSETALCVARQLGAVESIATQIADRASADGSIRGACHAWMWRAIALEGMGRLADADADADMTLQMITPAAWNVAQDAVQLLQARIGVERADLAGARARLAAIDPNTDVFINRVGYLITAAKLARAEGSYATERGALREIQAMSTEGEFGTWLLGCWPAALAISLGSCDEGRGLAAATLAAARSRDVPAEIGIALRAQALVAAARPDIELLQTAVAELERSDMALEHAHTLVELGAALRRSGHRRDARQPLALGLERAERCGATALVQRGLTELQATGARPRRMMLTGRDALTPSERRVAVLAAEGRSNREIAQTLFVTTKTVETHLSHIYRKLDVTRRTQLATVLATN